MLGDSKSKTATFSRNGKSKYVIMSREYIPMYILTFFIGKSFNVFVVVAYCTKYPDNLEAQALCPPGLLLHPTPTCKTAVSDRDGLLAINSWCVRAENKTIGRYQKRYAL